MLLQLLTVNTIPQIKLTKAIGANDVKHCKTIKRLILLSQNS